MVLKYSKRIQDMQKKLEPYFDGLGDLVPDAPENIKQLYKRYLEESDKEYLEALFL